MDSKEQSPQQVLKLSDDAIAVIRELIQLSLLTGTSVVDHLRALRLEIDGYNLLPTEDYVNSYNQTIVKLEEQAKDASLKAQKTLATD